MLKVSEKSSPYSENIRGITFLINRRFPQVTSNWINQDVNRRVQRNDKRKFQIGLLVIGRTVKTIKYRKAIERTNVNLGLRTVV